MPNYTISHADILLIIVQYISRITARYRMISAPNSVTYLFQCSPRLWSKLI